MKSTFTKILGASLLTFALGGLAHAVPLTGSIIFAGSATLNNVAPQNATAVVAWSNPILVGGSTIAGTGATATFAAPWQFNLLAPIPNFWVSGATSFQLNTSSITASGVDGQGQGFIVVGGNGILTSPGFEPTFATFNFTSQDPELGTGTQPPNGLFSFSASGIATGSRIPDGGSTAALLGVSLLAMSFLGRRFKFLGR